MSELVSICVGVRVCVRVPACVRVHEHFVPALTVSLLEQVEDTEALTVSNNNTIYRAYIGKSVYNIKSLALTLSFPQAFKDAATERRVKFSSKFKHAEY